MATSTGTKKTAKKPRIEREYEELLRRWLRISALPQDRGDSLEQPSALVAVRSVTTYGAYEDPI